MADIVTIVVLILGVAALVAGAREPVEMKTLDLAVPDRAMDWLKTGCQIGQNGPGAIAAGLAVNFGSLVEIQPEILMS